MQEKKYKCPECGHENLIKTDDKVSAVNKMENNGSYVPPSETLLECEECNNIFDSSDLTK